MRLAPINTGLYQKGNNTLENTQFYVARSTSQIDVAFVGNIAVATDLAPNATTGVISDHRSWSDLAEGIRAKGSASGIQLASTCPGYVGKRRADGSHMADALRNYQQLLLNVSIDRWSEIADRFRCAIDFSVRHGFEHIQIHAAHGYLWSLVMDPMLNPEGCHLDLLYGIIDHILSIEGIRGSIRMSWRTGYDHDKERQRVMLDLIERYPRVLDWDISNGYYNADKGLIYPNDNDGPIPWTEDAIKLANEYPDEQFVFSGNVWDPQASLMMLPKNVSVGLARPIIADPNFLASSARGQAKLCNYCGHCHYFSRGKNRISCPWWS